MAREAVISTSALNAYGTRILTEGLDIEQYKKNPIVLYMHRRGSREDIPIGIMENIRVDGDKIFGTDVYKRQALYGGPYSTAHGACNN